jgi:hypothetical protein
MMAGADIALRFAIVVGVAEFRLIEDASASVPVFIDQRSELHCAEACRAPNKRTSAQIHSFIRLLGGMPLRKSPLLLTEKVRLREAGPLIPINGE